jgi:metal transporter CNNM
VVAMASKPAMAVGRSGHNGLNARRPAVQGISKLLFLALAQITHVAAAPLKDCIGHSKKAHVRNHPDEEDPSLWLYLAVAAILVLLGGAFAGLTIA